MPRKNDEVEALAKVLHAASCEYDHERFGCSIDQWHEVSEFTREEYTAMARAAIAHLSKPKRGAKRVAK